jgi:hypothetical protein
MIRNRLAALFILLATFAATAPAQAQNFNAVLAAIQNSSWQGSFTSGPAGLPTCHGSIDVHFFGMRKEAFSGGAETVSYRHRATFSPLTPFMPFCETLGTSLSAVDVSGCEKLALKRQTVENGRRVTVPVRTLIARNGGRSLVVSTPACVNQNGRGVIKRLEFTVTNLEFTDAHKRSLTLTLALGSLVSNYRLERVGR